MVIEKEDYLQQFFKFIKWLVLGLIRNMQDVYEESHKFLLKDIKA